MHELHTKAREMAQEEDPEKLKSGRRSKVSGWKLWPEKKLKKKLPPPPSQKMTPKKVIQA
jgi:hypothetical protein